MCNGQLIHARFGVVDIIFKAFPLKDVKGGFLDPSRVERGYGSETRSGQTGMHSSGLAEKEARKTTSEFWCGTWHVVEPPSSGSHASNVRYSLPWCVTTDPLTLKPAGIGHWGLGFRVEGGEFGARN